MWRRGRDGLLAAGAGRALGVDGETAAPRRADTGCFRKDLNMRMPERVDQAFRLSFESSTREHDSSKKQPKRRRRDGV
jgi:hypothetical protein